MIGDIWEVIKLWQGWQRIGSIWAWITASAARVWAAIAILALAYAAWQFRRAEDWAGRFRQLESDTKTASAKATQQQAAVNHHPAAVSAALAEASNAQAPAYYRHALDIADLHRVRVQAPQGSAGRADLSGADHAAPIDDRPAPAADLVCRPEADDKLLVGAAARAAQMQADAQALIAAGAAVKSGPD